MYCVEDLKAVGLFYCLKIILKRKDIKQIFLVGSFISADNIILTDEGAVQMDKNRLNSYISNIISLKRCPSSKKNIF